MIALCVAKLFLLSPEHKLSLWIKQRTKKKTFLWKVWIKVHEKVRNVFVMSLRLSDHQVFHKIASSSIFFSISLRFSPFFRSYFVLPNLIFNARSWNKLLSNQVNILCEVPWPARSWFFVRLPREIPLRETVWFFIEHVLITLDLTWCTSQS